MDILFAALPFVTGGGGQVIKVVNVTDDIMDFKKVTVIGETMDRVVDTAHLYLKTLSLVIKNEIEQRGEFFGIKVKNND